jgi:hypothetical protein
MVAAALGLADALRDGPADAATLAARIGADAKALHRLMRVLAALDVLEPLGGNAFALAAMGRFLCTEQAGSCAPMARLLGRANIWRAWGGLSDTVRTGKTAFDEAHGCSVWAYRNQHPEERDVFHSAMASGTDFLARAVLDAVDFGRFAHLVDVGGGDGAFLARILDRHSGLHGTLFDMPDMVADSRLPARFAGRARAVSGDFFDTVPAGADAYLLKWILHDWDDENAVTILKSCRRAIDPQGRLLVAEYIIGPGHASPDGELMDLTMMVMTGGRERTTDEFAALLSAAGFQLASVTRTGTPFCIIEAVPGSRDGA